MKSLKLEWKQLHSQKFRLYGLGGLGDREKLEIFPDSSKLGMMLFQGKLVLLPPVELLAFLGFGLSRSLFGCCDS